MSIDKKKNSESDSLAVGKGGMESEDAINGKSEKERKRKDEKKPCRRKREEKEKLSNHREERERGPRRDKEDKGGRERRREKDDDWDKEEDWEKGRKDKEGRRDKEGEWGKGRRDRDEDWDKEEDWDKGRKDKEGRRDKEEDWGKGRRDRDEDWGKGRRERNNDWGDRGRRDKEERVSEKGRRDKEETGDKGKRDKEEDWDKGRREKRDWAKGGRGRDKEENWDKGDSWDKGRRDEKRPKWDHRRDYNEEDVPPRYWQHKPSDENRRKKRSKDDDEMEEGEYRDSSPERGEPLQRYYPDDKDKVVFKTEEGDRDKYLVGSRYYVEPSSGGGGRDRKRPRRDDNDQMKSRDKTTRDAEDKELEGISREQKKTVDLLTSRTGGAYIPPGKLRLMQANITDKTSVAYQRIAWEALKKSIHGHINKVNVSNIGVVARLLFKENIVRGRGLLSRSIVQAQAASPTFTNVYACLVSIINSKFPKIGELLLKRIIIQFKRAYKRNDKPVCLSSSTFIAHLVNQRVAHEIIALEMLTLLVENPTDDSVEVAVSFLKECGEKLAEVTTKGSNAIFDMLRNILHEGKLDKRVQYMIEVIFQVRKDNFRSFPAVLEELDLVNEEDQFTHLITMDEATDPQDLLNVFKLDGEYEQNEEKYKDLRKEILDDDDDDDDDDDSSDDGSGSDEGGEGSDGESGSDQEKKTLIIDNTETNLIALRKTIYLTIQSSLDFEECAHKLLKMELKPGQEVELCHMLLDCCAEQRTYEKFFGLLAQRFCQINRIYVGPFEDIFRNSYTTVHRLETNKLRNVAKFFAHLLFTDAISWDVLSIVKLNEEDTTSSSRIFIKILFQELSEYMGLALLNSRLKDVTLQPAMEGLFPRDNPKNTRFAINFFTSIGLGGLTDELREHLKSQPKPSAVPQLISQLSSSSSESSDSSDSSSDSSSSESSSESESEEEEAPKKKKADKKKNKKESVADKEENKSPKPSKTASSSKNKKPKHNKEHEHRNETRKKKKA